MALNRDIEIGGAIPNRPVSGAVGSRLKAFAAGVGAIQAAHTIGSAIGRQLGDAWYPPSKKVRTNTQKQVEYDPLKPVDRRSKLKGFGSNWAFQHPLLKKGFLLNKVRASHGQWTLFADKMKSKYRRKGRASYRSKKRLAKRYPHIAATACNLRTGGFCGKELKFKDETVVGATVDYAIGGAMQDPANNHIGGVAQDGSGGVSTRDGRAVDIKSIKIRGQLKMPESSATTSPDQARVCTVALVLDTQTNKAQMSPTDCFVDHGNNDTDYIAFRNLEYSSRFRVLWSKKFVFNPRTVHVTDATNDNITLEQRKYFEINWNGDVPVHYTSTGQSIAYVMDNSFHLMCWTGASGPGNQLELDYVARTRFYD